MTELSTPHAVLVRTRDFTAKNLTTGSKDVPLIIREEGNDDEDADVQLLRQESNVPSKDQSIKTEDNASKSLPQDLNTTDQTGGGGGENDALSVSSHDDDDDEAVEEEEDEKKKLSLKTSYEGFQIYGRILCLVVKRKGQPNNIPASMNRQKNSNASTSVAAGANGQESIVEMVQRTASSAGRRDEGIMEGWMRSTQIGNESRGIAGGRDPDSDDGDDAG